MARAKVREIGQAAHIQPLASPVDTYVRPADPAPSPLHDLARGLASFDSGLNAFLGKRKKERDAVDEVRAQAAFNKNNQVGWAEAVKQGLVPAHASPVFVKSYKKAQGNLAGIKLREKFNQAYLTWGGRNSNDPEAFQTFLADFMASNIGTEDPDILLGLMPHVQALTADSYSAFGEDSARQTYNGAVNTQSAIAGETLDWANTTGLASGEGTDYGAVKDDLIALREAALASGIRMEDFDKQLVDTIRDKAVEHGDPALLDLLDEVWPGYDVNLSSIPEFRDVKAEGLAALERRARQQMADMDKEAQEAEKKAKAVLASMVARMITADPTAEIPEDLIRAWEKMDGMARKKIADIRKSLINGLEAEDPEDLLQVERLIQEGATTEDILELAGPDGPINDVQTLRNAIDRAEKRRKATAEGTGILSTSSAKNFINTIKERTTRDDVSRLWMPEGMSDEGLEARRDFEVMLMDWDERNPNASQMEREEAIYRAGEIILRRIDKEERTYTSQADAAKIRAEQEALAAEQQGQQQDQSKAVTEPAPGEEPEDTSSGQSFRDRLKEAMEIDAGIGRPRQADTEAYNAWHDAETIRLYSGDAPPKLEDMDSSYRQGLEEDAKRLGMSAEEFNQVIWETVKEDTEQDEGEEEDAPDDGIDSSITNSISSTIDDALTAQPAVFRTASAGADPQVRSVAPVLDLLGNSEGTDEGRGYNETLAYGVLTGGDVDLVNMTLGEIDALQTRMLSHPDNKWNSSALGRYQIVRKTLRKLKVELGLKDDMKFTPELQDRLAVALLKGRGYDRWKAGKMTDKAFLNALAREWASVPTSTGKGYYKDQNARATTEQVYAALRAMRGVRRDGVPKAYAFIPDDELDRFMEWNADPLANHEKNLGSVDTRLASVVRRAQEIAGVAFIVGSGKRDLALQKKAKAWGWSKTLKSAHLDGNAVDLWPLDKSGAVKFDKKLQLEVVRAMKQAAKELGVKLNVGADWKSFQDLPHFALKV